MFCLLYRHMHCHDSGEWRGLVGECCKFPKSSKSSKIYTFGMAGYQVNVVNFLNIPKHPIFTFSNRERGRILVLAMVTFSKSPKTSKSSLSLMGGGGLKSSLSPMGREEGVGAKFGAILSPDKNVSFH